MLKPLRFLVAVAVVAAAVGCRPQAQRPKGEDASPAPSTPTERVAPPVAASADNPLAPYIRHSVVDEFNPKVTDQERRHPPKPRRGGALVIRMPSDVRTLNPLTHTGIPARIVLTYLRDALISRDPELLEYIPRMAAYWKVRDYVELRDGTRIEGLITSETETAVEIVPDVSRWTLLLVDVVSSATEADTGVATIETRYGDTLRGRITRYEYTLDLVETPDAPPRTVAKSDLGTWTDTVGGEPRERPAIMPRCIYEFRLREGIRWHDGQPVTMYDLQCGFDTMRNEQVDCSHLRVYYIDIEKLEVPDPLTAKFTYSKPYFLALEFCGSLDFLPKHILEPERFEDDPEGYADFFNKHPMGQPGGGQFVGIGPYKLADWESGQEIVLVRNNDFWASQANLPYWKPDQPYLDRIVFRVIQETTPALRELENGTIHADFDVEPATWLLPRTNSAEFTSQFVRAKFTIPGYTYIGWNQERAVFQDVPVRRALTMLIPRERILREIHHGLGDIATGPFYKYGPTADPTVEPIPYDPREAKRLLREAGWIDRDGDGILDDRDGEPFAFEYTIHTAREYHAKIADIVKQSLGQAGIDMTIRKIDWTEFGETVQDHNFDAVRFAWSAVLDGDPYQIWHSSQSKGRGSNFVTYSNERVDRLIEEGREEFDPVERWKKFRKVYRIIHDEQPFTFMFVFESLAFYHTKFRGVKFYPHDPGQIGYDLTEWWIAE